MRLRNKHFALFLALAMLLPEMIACSNDEPPVDEPPVSETSVDETSIDKTPDSDEPTLNGISVTEYTIVYSESGLDFNKRAAEYISKEIETITGTAPAVVLDTEKEDTGNEILVGITNRNAVSIAVEDYADTFEFVSVSAGDSVMLYGEEYMIAGAAYDLVKKLTDTKAVIIPGEITVGEPVFEDPNNVIFLIGDGMGFNSLAYGNGLYEYGGEGKYAKYENVSGYHQHIVADRLPYKAQAYTHSYNDDVTDSAAGATALATGYKTYNDVVGLDINLEPLKNLSELAIELGKATAILTTDVINGATPSAFSVHTLSREDSEEILEYQQYDSNIDHLIGSIRNPTRFIRDTLLLLEEDEDGFFMMYEEAYIDKASHNRNPFEFYNAYTRLNTALRVFLEFLMYHPDTVIILTADHETGGITYDENKAGGYRYTTANHTQVNVPFYAIGKGTEIIDGKTFDNTGISKFTAQLMGVDGFGNPELTMLTDKTGLETMSQEEKDELAIQWELTYQEYKNAHSSK